MDGSDGIGLDADGDLVIATSSGRLALKRPVAYQEMDGTRHFVASEFAVDDERVVRIRVGDYDHARTLVIDPVVSYATYLGGGGTEQGTAIAVDAAGNAYVTGYTTSIDFPMVNALDRSIGRKGDVEVFVSKLNPAGTALVWSTYIGGSAGTERAVGIAVDAAGSVYLTGQTSGIDFPTSADAWQKAITGGGAFVDEARAGRQCARLFHVCRRRDAERHRRRCGRERVRKRQRDAGLPDDARRASAIDRRRPRAPRASSSSSMRPARAPVFATFLGGAGGEDATSIALDARGGAYVGRMDDIQRFPGSQRISVHAKRSEGRLRCQSSRATDPRSSIRRSSAASLDDAVNAIAVDAAGNAYVAGETYSSDFPVRNGFQMQKAGFRLINSSVGNAFVAKLSPPAARSSIRRSSAVKCA